MRFGRLVVTGVFVCVLAAKAEAKPTLTITPAQALADVPVHIVASGLEPGAKAQISAETKDQAGVVWASSIDCLADKRGRIELDSCSSSTGSYPIQDGMGLFWSMKAKEPKPPLFVEPESNSAMYDFTLSVNGRPVATRRVERIFVVQGVRRVALNQEVVGTTFLPSGSGKHPAVILLGGSGGGHPMDPLAALLASRGYATLSLAYFGSPGTPRALVDIPIETVERAITWLAQQSNVDASRIGILGHSRGSELALLAACYFAQIKAVVALAPSILAWSGVDPTDYRHPHAAWTYGGKPIPAVPDDPTAYPRLVLPELAKTHRLVLRPMFEAGMQRIQAPDAAAIPVEKTNGPILFVAGDADDVWPATTFAEMGMQRLSAARHGFKDEYLHYPDAGHWIFERYIPIDGRVVLNLPERPNAFGGTPEGNARAAEESWPQIVNFLAAALKGRRMPPF